MKKNIFKKLFRLWAEVKKKPVFAGISFGVVIVVILISLLMRQEDIGTKMAASELENLSQNIRRHYQNKADYWGLSTESVINNKIYPQKMYANHKLKNFFGNDVFIGQGLKADMVMPGMRRFDIVYIGLNYRQCVELGSFRFNEKFWYGISGIRVNDTDFDWNLPKNTLPIKTDILKELCKSKNNFIWHFE